MAVRSGAGTGVMVSLVVFVILTIVLLIFAIVFHVDKTKAMELEVSARNDLARFIRDSERNDERFKALEQSAGNRSMAGHLVERYDNLARFVTGTTPRSLDEIRADLERFGVTEDGSVRATLETLSVRVRNVTNELETERERLRSREEALAERDRQIQEMRQEHQDALARVSEAPDQFERENETFRRDLRQSIDVLGRARDQLRSEYDGRITELENELDNRGRDLVRMRSRIAEFERIMNEARLRAASPDLLVDASVLDVDPALEQIFIDRGQQDRVVLGMNFEVYDDPAALRVDPRTQQLPRGKATVQIINVGRNSSTGKITRSVPGRPIIKGNVLANAVYDPNRTFKFLVHGRFDVDGDGRATEAEAEYIRGRIIEWGGQVVVIDEQQPELPGDLDFLVLGMEPPMPAPLPTSPPPTRAQIEAWSIQRLANQRYRELFTQAQQAQIPVLNANRFFILTGLDSGR